MKFDSYTLKARAIPALLASIPFFSLHYFLLSPALGAFWGAVVGLKIASDLTFLSASFFLFMQVNRILSKEVFEKRMYDNGLNFPTTTMLLHTDFYFSGEYKRKIYQKIQSDFKIKIPSTEKEKKNEYRSRQVIAEAISHIRARIGKGTLLGQHNAEYGFIRNFTGGNLLAVVISILNLIIFSWAYPNPKAQMISWVMILVYSVLSLLSRWMIDSVGSSYAKILIQEYMAL